MASEGNTAPVADARALPGRGSAQRLPGWSRWVFPGVILILLPKCLVCVAGYLALAAGFGVANQELCGGAANRAGFWAASARPLLIPGILLAALLTGLAARRAISFISRPVRKKPARS